MLEVSSQFLSDGLEIGWVPGLVWMQVDGLEVVDVSLVFRLLDW